MNIYFLFTHFIFFRNHYSDAQRTQYKRSNEQMCVQEYTVVHTHVIHFKQILSYCFHLFLGFYREL